MEMHRASLAGIAIVRLLMIQGMSAQMLRPSEAFIAVGPLTDVVLHGCWAMTRRVGLYCVGGGTDSHAAEKERHLDLY